jgi:kynurenine formamidase
MEQPRNWGRWGTSDERGTANYVTADVTARAATLARTGRVYPLAIPLKANAPIWPTRHKNWHVATFRNLAGPGPGGAEDILMMHTHGTTHVDALCHVFADGKLYNGFAADESIDGTGARRNAISNVGALVTRGLLADVAGHRGEAYLAQDHVISPEEIEGSLAAHGLEARSGDVLLIRTGWLGVWESDPARFDRAQPGLGIEAAHWAGDHEIVALGADNSAVEAFPVPGGLAVHQEFIRNQGGYLIELLDLESLAADGVYEFMFVLAPLQIARGLGSPVTPVAIC